MRFASCLFLIAPVLYGQGPIPSPPVDAPVSRLPSSWGGVGAAYNGYSNPAVNGWISYAFLVSEKGMLYSYSTHDVTSSKSKPYTIQTSTRSGLATIIRKIGPVSILGLADAGVSASGENVGGAYSGGGVAILRIGQTKWTLVFGVRSLKTAIGGTQQIYSFGGGRMAE